MKNKVLSIGLLLGLFLNFSFSQFAFANGIMCKDIKLAGTVFIDCDDTKTSHGSAGPCGAMDYLVDFIPQINVTVDQNGIVKASMQSLNELTPTEVTCDLDPYAPTSMDRICKFANGIQVDVLADNGVDYTLVIYAKGANSPSARISNQKECVLN